MVSELTVTVGAGLTVTVPVALPLVGHPEEPPPKALQSTRLPPPLTPPAILYQDARQAELPPAPLLSARRPPLL